MKCLGLRHVGIRIDGKRWRQTVAYYEALGFTRAGPEQSELIDGRPASWIKLTDGLVTLELIAGRDPHLAFTVDEINADNYYYVTPEGYRVQFDQDPSGNVIEFVEKGSGNVEKLYKDE